MYILFVARRRIRVGYRGNTIKSECDEEQYAGLQYCKEIRVKVVFMKQDMRRQDTLFMDIA